MAATVTPVLALAHSPRIRYATGALMYFAQGIPQGLLVIAIPAWLASLGVGAGDIGTYLAVIILPWALKLVTGPFMDRYQFLPMGRRKPWVLGAQSGLSLSLLALMLIRDPAEQIALLMLIGVLINSFTATQDVAVDGMAIDLTPLNEQGRLNAFMSFGKAAGWAATAAVSGVLLVHYGLQVTALAAAITAAVLGIAFAFVVERDGERRMPWTAGSARVGPQARNSFGALFGGLNQVMWSRASLVVLGIMFFDGLVAGYGHALMPVAAITVFGYTTPEWASLVAVMGLAGAVAALALGPLIDRFGAKRMLFLTASLVGIHAFMIAQTQFLWQDSTYVRVMLSVWVLLVPVVMVCVIALAMSVCSTRCSATQFAIYMSTANLGHSAGAKVFGMFADRTSYDDTYKVLAMMVAVMIIVLVFHHQKKADGAAPERREHRAYAVRSGGGHGALFFSGALRCPKCRADMERVVLDGTEVDRCHHCRGLWFDTGELGALKGNASAAALDSGSAKQGRQYNFIDDYRCPRCGGAMNRVADPEQPHIGFETCTTCQGSFFDAGEFRDLSQHTLSDFFRDLVIPDRT